MLVAGNLPYHNIEVLALLSAALLWRLRDRLSRLEMLGLLMALTAFFLPVHNYDLVILAPLAGAMAVWAAPSVKRSGWALVAAGLLFVPLRFAKLADSPLLLRWREFILLILIAFLVAAALNRPAVSAPVADASGDPI